MLFPLAKHWICQIQQHQVTISDGGSLYKVARQTCKSVNESIEELFTLLPMAGRLSQSVEFIIDIPEIHYFITPWEDGLITPAQLRNYTLSLIMKERELKGDFAVSFLDCGYRKSQFSALIDKKLIHFITDISRRYRMRLAKCHTYFGYYFSQYSKVLGDNIVYVCAGEKQTTFAVRDAHSWHRVFSLHLPEQKTEEKIRKSLMLAGVTSSSCKVFYSCKDDLADLNSTIELKGCFP